MYIIFFKKSAVKELVRLPKSVIEKVRYYTSLLEKQPVLINSVKLIGFKNLYRIRIGDYRMIYLVEHSIQIITITKTGHRKNVYKTSIKVPRAGWDKSFKSMHSKNRDKMIIPDNIDMEAPTSHSEDKSRFIGNAS